MGGPNYNKTHITILQTYIFFIKIGRHHKNNNAKVSDNNVQLYVYLK